MDQEFKSWTDDLPKCPYSGIGLATNKSYSITGPPKGELDMEDRSFYFEIDDTTYLYGIFDGHGGSHVADFAAQRLAAEVLLGQLGGKPSNADVKEVLRQAFSSVERGYFESIGDLLAERTTLLCELPEGVRVYEAQKKYPDLAAKLATLDKKIAGSCSVVVALIFNGQLYVANVGDARALLCKTGEDGVLRVIQLSIDHDLTNEDELLRLSQLGLDLHKITNPKDNECRKNLLTRCLGNYPVKGGYRDLELLRSSSREPIIAEPDITGGIPIDESCKFLLLTSAGVHHSLEEATLTEQANKDMAQLVVEEFSTQSSLTGVAQAVVDRIVRMHRDKYVQDPAADHCRDDITLLLRNFSYPLNERDGSLKSTQTTTQSSIEIREKSVWGSNEFKVVDTVSHTTTSSTESSSFRGLPSYTTLQLDENGRIAPYVDFSSFYAAIEEAQATGLDPFDGDV